MSFTRFVGQPALAPPGRPAADSWYRSWPERALDTLDELGLSPLVTVLDVGGGDGRVAQGLLERGFADVTVLAPGPGPGEPRGPRRTFDVWHDRAWLQFRLPGRGWQQYLDALRRHTHPGSLAVISSFTPTGGGPAARSPMRLAARDLALLLGAQFVLVDRRDETHLTTRGVEQAFQWSVFQRAEVG